MRILHVYKDFCPPVEGGIERHIALMCRFQRQWADVEALTCSRACFSHVADREGTRVTEAGEWGRFQSAPVSPLFPFHLRRIPADVLVIHLPNPTASIAYLLARPRGRLIVRYHSDIVRQAGAMRLYGPLQDRFLEKAHLILATSQAYIDSSPVLRRFPERCRAVPLGILPETFADPDPNAVMALRERYGGEYVFFCGRHRYYKGLDVLVRAAKGIRGRVVIAGDGPERDRCMALARKAGVNAVFPGRLTHDELVCHLHGCAVFAFPSTERSEAFGMSMLEAHACGRPVVATRIGTGVESVNLDERTGINVVPGDPEALACAINDLLLDPVRRRAMGEFARQRVRAEFHAERIAKTEFDLYAESAATGVSG